MQTIETVADLIPIAQASNRPPKVIASDVDHTLVDFDAGHEAGIKAIAEVTDSQFAQRVDDIFQLLVRGNRTASTEAWDERELHDELLSALAPHQIHDLEQYGNRKWSRESWILQTALESGRVTNADFITEIRETYWTAVAEYGYLFPEVPEFFAWLEANGIELVAMTGSDSVVTINGDENPKLLYEPTASWDYKMKRLGNIPAKKILIGDPHDKPHQNFFDGVYAAAQDLGAVSPADVWFVGDSKGGDLEVPEKDGYPTFLVKRPKA